MQDQVQEPSFWLWGHFLWEEGPILTAEATGCWAEVCGDGPWGRRLGLPWTVHNGGVSPAPAPQTSALRTPRAVLPAAPLTNPSVGDRQGCQCLSSQDPAPSERLRKPRSQLCRVGASVSLESACLRVLACMCLCPRLLAAPAEEGKLSRQHSLCPS